MEFCIQKQNVSLIFLKSIDMWLRQDYNTTRRKPKNKCFNGFLFFGNKAKRFALER